MNPGLKAIRLVQNGQSRLSDELLYFQMWLFTHPCVPNKIVPKKSYAGRAPAIAFPMATACSRLLATAAL